MEYIYTNKIPTGPGDFKWKPREDAMPITLEVFESRRNGNPPELGFALRPAFEFKRVEEVGGYWCELFPESAVKESYKTGWDDSLLMNKQNFKKGN